MDPCSVLSHDDAAGPYLRAGINLDTEPLTAAVPSVP